jgi:hypothetical protein
MTDYTKTVNFAAKDSLPSGDSGKIIRGTEFDTEFNNISTAVATKADLASPTFTGTANFANVTVTSLTLNGVLVTSTANELNILDGVTATTAELNKLDGVTATTTELNYVDGVTSAIQTQLDARLQKAGGTITGDVTFNQDVNLNIGTNSEMQLFRSSTASIIQETGGSDLFILSNGPNGVVLGKDSPFERSLRAMVDSGVELYYDNVLKTQTTANGLEVVGVTDTDQLRVTTPSVPASATATGTAGDIAWDADYIYVCTATDTWKRVAISTWS